MHSTRRPQPTWLLLCVACSGTTRGCAARTDCYAICDGEILWCSGASERTCPAKPRPPAEMRRGPSPTAEVTVLDRATRP